MDRLDELEVLIAVLDTGSLAGASRKLRRSPPAVTRMLSSLEAKTGIRLVERSTRRLAATDAGKRLAERARRLLADYDDAMREDLAAPPRGTLRVTAPVVFGRRHVAPVVNAYLDLFPEMQAELVLNDRNLDLIDEGLDVAVRIGKLADSAMVARQVGVVRQVLVASPAYIARRGEPRSPEELSKHEVILTASRSNIAEWRLMDGGQERSVRLSPRLTVNEVDAVLSAAKAGRGVARALSYQVAGDLENGDLVRLLQDCEPPPLPVHLVVPSSRHMAQKVRAFLEHAAQALGSLPVIRGG